MADYQTFIVSWSLTINYEMVKLDIYYTSTKSERTLLAFPKTGVNLVNITVKNGEQSDFPFFFLKFLQSLVLNRMASYRLSLILLKRVMFRVDQNILHILNIMHQSEQYLFFQSILLYISKNKSLISMTK